LKSTAHHAEATDRRLTLGSETWLMLFSAEYSMGLFSSTPHANSLPQPRPASGNRGMYTLTVTNITKSSYTFNSAGSVLTMSITK
jgi:hypothetical protein